jgi:hypothetical protein
MPREELKGRRREDEEERKKERNETPEDYLSL